MAETLQFENEYGAFTVASRGASLLELKMGAHDLLYDFKQNAGDWAAGAVLFPFPVRMASERSWSIMDKSFIGRSMTKNIMQLCTDSLPIKPLKPNGLLMAYVAVIRIMVNMSSILFRAI